MHAILAEDAHQRMGKTQTRHKTDALLRGLMFGPDGGKYHITYSKKPSGKKGCYAPRWFPWRCGWATTQ